MIEDDPFKRLRDQLVASYTAKVKAVPPLLRKGMVNAYSDGVNSMISWILQVEMRQSAITKVKAEGDEPEVSTP